MTARIVAVGIALTLALVTALWPRVASSQSDCPPLGRSGPLIVNVPRVQGGAGSTTAGDLIVPGGVTCSLVGSQHFGNVSVQRGGALSLDNTTISGEVRSEDAQSITIVGSRLLGSLQADGGNSLDLRTTEVAGSVLIDRVSAGVIVNQSTIGGSLIVANSGDTIEITENSIGGELRCDSNRGTLKVEGNTVVGDVDPACQGG